MSHFLMNLWDSLYFDTILSQYTLCSKIISRNRCCRRPGYTPVSVHLNAWKRAWRGNKYFPWVHLKKKKTVTATVSLKRFPKAKCLPQSYKHSNSPQCTNNHTHNPHPASTSLFPKGSKRNQPSNRGVLCKQAKGISTCGKRSKQGYRQEQ